MGDSRALRENSPRAKNKERFVDYFVIAGLESCDLEPLEIDKNGSDNLLRPPLDQSYRAKILGHFPEQDVPWNPFDAAGICMLSLPQGLRFRTQKHQLEPRFHSFATTREDGKRCHGFSLVFYEEVRSTSICSAMHTLQSMFITELSSGQTPPSLRRVRESEGVSKSLPRHFKIVQNPHAAASYYDVTKDKLYVTKAISLVCQTAYAHAAELFLTNLYKCLPRSPGPGLSLESYVYNVLYEVCTPPPGKCIRIYLPPEEPHKPPIAWLLQHPDMEELPLLDFPIRQMFSILGVDAVLQLFSCVLLEHQVLLRSSDYQKLMIIAECITALLYPFSWPHVYAPILPGALFHFLDAPVPFVMGLHSDAESPAKIGTEASLCYVDVDRKAVQLPEELPTFPHKVEFAAEIATILDRYRIRSETGAQPPAVLSPKALLRDHQRHPTDIMSASCTLPSGLQLRQRHANWQPGGDLLRATAPEVDDHMPPATPPANEKTPAAPTTATTLEQYVEDLKFNNSIREVFLNRFVQIFASYEHFVIFPAQSKEEWLTNRESLQNFDKASFLSEHPQHHRPFLSRFLESQMFATLIDDKIMSTFGKDVGSGQIHDEIALFDQRIRNLRKRYGGESLIRIVNYEPCILARDTQRRLDKRLASVDMEVTKPLEILPHRPAYFRSFPVLDKSVLNQECPSRYKKASVPSRSKHENGAVTSTRKPARTT